jgi:2'-phosphotransferase
MNKLDKASRKLTQILRHMSIQYNLSIDNCGYVKLNDILQLNLEEFKDITLDDIDNIVDSNDKKRLQTIVKDNEIYIRATQGHSKEVGSLINDKYALEEIPIDTSILYIYHGTKNKYLESIKTTGLIRMSRKHIHFVEDLERDKQISGFKKESDLILKVDLKKCMIDGMKFYKSNNNVILTEGFDGIIPPNYINFI